ncbi:MAG: hypothetical protein A2283_15945 [Lentisphaerae bacterium RIFOXYA12_FULL_48_11]|nr:MAG: hypothetical protein A2283_15945 [Lentisphaerae bacterium RIFOXYA12_FULL_48_11]
MIVVDSNVLAARNLTGVQTPLAERVELVDRFWIVPPLWRYEFENILTKGLWARQFTTEGALHVWQVVMARMADNEHEPSVQKVIDLSARYRITAYDANFIALAMEMDVMCVTEDGELQKKFPSIAVSMKAFLEQGITGGQVREARATYGARRKKTVR